jgi:murein DD-endopeptidase MepM/ murein hydrolase activator NlpD
LEPGLVFQFPFDKNTEVICTQSPKNPYGSHSFSNSLYAIDLATPYDRPASVVRASADGKAFVFNDCKTPEGNPSKTEIDRCGLGWGNHVRILHKDGIVSFYVHLESIMVNDGDRVVAGQALGIEGATGLAGHRHLHWDVHRLNGSNVADWEKVLSNPGWGGASIPYFFEVSIDGIKQVMSSQDVRCRHGDMTQTGWRGTR